MAGAEVALPVRRPLDLGLLIYRLSSLLSGTRRVACPRYFVPLFRPKAASASVPKPSNDNRSVEQPVAIVTARKPRGRKATWTDGGGETPESVKAFLARMIRPGGPMPSDASK